MVADDPMGRKGPNLEQFLLKSSTSKQTKSSVNKLTTSAISSKRSRSSNKVEASSSSSSSSSSSFGQENNSQIVVQQPQAKRQKTDTRGPLNDLTNTTKQQPTTGLIQRNITNEKFSGQFVKRVAIKSEKEPEEEEAFGLPSLLPNPVLMDFNQINSQALLEPLVVGHQTQTVRRVIMQTTDSEPTSYKNRKKRSFPRN